ncbi:hypothetical protein AWRI1631_71570 [Saccharomyces cerevisiae AWRI1631]|uniref:Uncharacterized protein n=1 Tax=Saccharomyces cerevisiae (strain AWRI1631) TaxID=545124 RepID=B5VIN0_YEAS6|nr:hypothetical protein AWRI1631_71570 [Saccharomyces cerevisiae AWRI1631]
MWEEKERKISHERKKKQITVKTTHYISASPPSKKFPRT